MRVEAYGTNNVRQTILLCLAIVLACVTGFATLQKHDGHTSDLQATGTTAQSSASYDNRIEKPDTTFDLKVDDHKLASGPSEIKVKQGESVRVNIMAIGDDEEAIELEGYGIHTESHVSDDGPGGFSFIADKTGSFKFFAKGEAGEDGQTGDERYPLGIVVVEP